MTKDYLKFLLKRAEKTLHVRVIGIGARAHSLQDSEGFVVGGVGLWIKAAPRHKLHGGESSGITSRSFSRLLDGRPGDRLLAPIITGDSTRN